MPTRRSVLASMASLLGLPLAGPAAALAAPGRGIDPEIRRRGRVPKSLQAEQADARREPTAELLLGRWVARGRRRQDAAREGNVLRKVGALLHRASISSERQWRKCGGHALQV